MKLLSIAVPCYNSSAYMRRCIDSLLPGGEDVEIIIVNDGSGDNTADIAEEYRERFPGLSKTKAGTVRQSIPVWNMQRDCTLRWLTAMTG